MSTAVVVTRFAPSPTGELHLGNARTALFSALYARRETSGRFLLRIEDTDAERSRSEFTQGLLQDLAWLGLAWDGEVLHQSRRTAFYDAQLQRLAQAGHVYPCFCSSETLALARRAQLSAGRPPRYPGTCRALAPEQREARLARGDAHTLRFAVPLEGEVAFTDFVQGPRSFACRDIGDFVLCRTDGSPAFFFSNALDDSDCGVTHVLRGEDHLSNTPRQLLILQALALPAPAYGHVALLTGSDGAKLSKRNGAASVRELRAQGYLAQALANHLYRLGYSTADNALLGLAQMAAGFDPAHLQRAPAQFDEAQLRHWQRLAVHALSLEEALAWLAPVLPRSLGEDARRAFVTAVRANLLLPADALEWLEVVFGEAPAPDAEAAAALAAAPAGLFAAAAQAARDQGNDYGAIVAAAKAGSGAKGASLFKPLRAALTGRLHGPELAPLLAAMPPGAALRRLQRFT